MSEKILVVDDAPDLTLFLKRILVREGYQVAIANDAREGLRQAYAFQPDLIMLDVMMPGMDGWDMLSRLREFSDIPVIMLTALDSPNNKVQGLDTGADDYITKPFETEELKARVRAVLRRASLLTSDADHILSFDGGKLVIDPASHLVTVGGEMVDLTPTEYKLLLYLAFNAGRVLSSEQILESVWGLGYEDSLDNVKVYIRRLRSKVEEDPRNPQYILTQWGVGYYLARN